MQKLVYTVMQGWELKRQKQKAKKTVMYKKTTVMWLKTYDKKPKM